MCLIFQVKGIVNLLLKYLKIIIKKLERGGRPPLMEKRDGHVATIIEINTM